MHCAQRGARRIRQNFVDRLFGPFEQRRAIGVERPFECFFVDRVAIETIRQAEPPPAREINRHDVRRRRHVLQIVHDIAEVGVLIAHFLRAGHLVFELPEMIVQPRIHDPQQFFRTLSRTVVIPPVHLRNPAALRLGHIALRDIAHLQRCQPGNRRTFEATVELFGGDERELLMQRRVVGSGVLAQQHAHEEHAISKQPPHTSSNSAIR